MAPHFASHSPGFVGLWICLLGISNCTTGFANFLDFTTGFANLLDFTTEFALPLYPQDLRESRGRPLASSKGEVCFRMPPHSRQPGGRFRFLTTGPPTSNLRIFLSLWPIRPGNRGFLAKTDIFLKAPWFCGKKGHIFEDTVVLWQKRKYVQLGTSGSDEPFALMGPDLAIDALADPGLAINTLGGHDLANDARRGGFLNFLAYLF